MNYHAKSGATSLKIDWVILNLVFGGHFVFGDFRTTNGTIIL